MVCDRTTAALPAATPGRGHEAMTGKELGEYENKPDFLQQTEANS